MTSEKENPDITEDLDFELIIGDAGGQIDNGDVPIRWCMKPDFVKQLEERKIEDPHVLIASYTGSDYSTEMDRKLVPLSELMTYLRFTKAGQCRVVGFLLDGSEGRKALWEKWMRKHSGHYENIVSDWDGTIYNDIEYGVVSTSEFVEIPENVFGKEPSPWVKWYVNVWHNAHNKVTDECDFRKRFLIAFIFKWIPFIPFIIGLVTFRAGKAGGVLSCGYFGKVKFFRTFRPYKYPSMEYNVFDNPINIIEDNKFILERKCFAGKEGQRSKMLVGMAFTPIVLLIVAVVVGLATEPNGFIGWALISAAYVMGVAGIFFVVDVTMMFIETMIRFNIGGKIGSAIFAIFVKIVDMIPNNGIPTKYKKIGVLVIASMFIAVALFFAFKYLLAFLGIMILTMVMSFGFFFLTLLFANQILDWLDRYFAMSAKDNTYGEITELLCPKDEDNLRPNYKYIPKKQRTIRLWYHDLKNKVCKPMQS